MFFDVTEAKHINDYRIRLSFEDGSTGIADLSDYPEGDTVFRAFLDMDFFRNFSIERGTVIWDTGELDIAPERFYAIATCKPVRYHSMKNQAV